MKAGGAVVGMFDPSPTSLNGFDAPPGTPRFSSLEEMLTSVEADAAFIASPNCVHAEQFIACAEAGIDTWVEKPIAITLEEARAMRDAARNGGIKVAIPFAANEDALERDGITAARDGVLGTFVQMTMVRTCRAGFHVNGGRHYAIEKPEVSGGWIAHHLCHMIDFAMKVGGPVDHVYCRTDTTIENPKPHQEEAITCVLHFANGGTATLCDNQVGHQQTQTVIAGHRGSWIGREDKARVRAKADDILCSSDLNVNGKLTVTRWTVEQYAAYRASKPSYVKQFLDAIINDGPWDTTIDEGIDVMRVYLAAQESAETNRVIELKIDA